MKNVRRVVLLIAIGSSVAFGQSFYLVSKNQGFLQTSATSVVADPLGPYWFDAQAAANVTLTLPGGGMPALAPDRDGGFRYRQFFSTKAALDLAFPNGTYRYSGGTIPALTLNLANDNYPATTPQLVSASNGTWNAGGVLVVNPAQPVTLNFNTFSGYTSSGAAGHINFYLTGMTDESGTELRLETDMASVPFLGQPAQTTPLTSYTIPAGRMTSGRVYQAWLNYDTVATVDLTTVPGSLVGTLFSKEVSFFVAAQTPGTSTPAPVIVAPPTSRVAALGGSVTFSVSVTAGGNVINYENNPNHIPIGFNWSHNGQSLNDVQSSGNKYINRVGDTLTVNALTAADAGTYAVTVFTAGGVVISAPATLSFSTLAAPVITNQPRGATVNAGSTVALAVTATGTPTPAFQWYKGTQMIAGATSDTLVLSRVTAAAAGDYTVEAANSVSTVRSQVATLVITSGQPSRLPNLSVRTNLGAGQTLIVGFATEGAKTMLVRGLGPGLGIFGVTAPLPDPTIELYNAAAVKIDENNDWSATLASVFTDVGAFALPAGSRDAALQRLCTGAHTAQIKSSGSGVVLVEVYDSGGPGKLTNVSARNAVGTGDNILIAGFVVDGTAAKTLLIRGVGPKLAEFGVGGVLADPKLEIYNSSGQKIAENDNWNALLQPVGRTVGAFDLTLGSRDAALLLTLPPASYTAQISGVGGTTGEAIVEVYEVP
jgi:hypothetical protein